MYIYVYIYIYIFDLFPMGHIYMYVFINECIYANMTLAASPRQPYETLRV